MLYSMHKKTDIIGMNYNIMRRLIVLALLITISGTETNAQHFKGYHPTPGKEQKLFRPNGSWGIIVLDDSGNELRRTEPIYWGIFYSEGFDRAAVGIPLVSFEPGRGAKYPNGFVWVCLDIELRPLFVFPSNTHHIYRIFNGMFLYKDKMEHSSTVGLVDGNGNVIFKAPYDRIYIEKDQYVGVKNITEQNDNTGYETWAIEFKTASSDNVYIYKLITPERESLGLHFEDQWSYYQDEEDFAFFEELLKSNAFHRGLNHFIHYRKNEALECFREALNSNDQKIVFCAKKNIETIMYSND